MPSLCLHRLQGISGPSCSINEGIRTWWSHLLTFSYCSSYCQVQATPYRKLASTCVDVDNHQFPCMKLICVYIKLNEGDDFFGPIVCLELLPLVVFLHDCWVRHFTQIRLYAKLLTRIQLILLHKLFKLLFLGTAVFNTYNCTTNTNTVYMIVDACTIMITPLIAGKLHLSPAQLLQLNYSLTWTFLLQHMKSWIIVISTAIKGSTISTYGKTMNTSQVVSLKLTFCILVCTVSHNSYMFCHQSGTCTDVWYSHNA